MCKGGEFDLSFESLTSHAIRQVLRELPTTDPVFFAELSQSRSHMDIVPSLTAEQVALEDAPSNNEIGPADDSDVPFLEVCAHHHESLNTTPSVDPAQLYVPNGTDGLMSTAVAEDTLIESVDGVESHPKMTLGQPAGFAGGMFCITKTGGQTVEVVMMRRNQIRMIVST